MKLDDKAKSNLNEAPRFYKTGWVKTLKEAYYRMLGIHKNTVPESVATLLLCQKTYDNQRKRGL